MIGVAIVDGNSEFAVMLSTEGVYWLGPVEGNA